MTSFYYNENGQYILEGDDLIFFSAYTDNVKSVRLDLNKPQLHFKKDGFYAIQRQPDLKYKKI